MYKTAAATVSVLSTSVQLVEAQQPPCPITTSNEMQLGLALQTALHDSVLRWARRRCSRLWPPRDGF